MELRRAVLLIVAIYILGFSAHVWHLRKTVYGDGVFYYAWLRSVVVDHDINFADEYAREQVNQPKTIYGQYGNKYSVGPALLWAPLYVTTHAVVRGDGWGLPYQLSVGIISVLYALSGLILLIRLIKLPPRIMSLILLLTAGATNLLFYGSLDTVNSHALSFFTAVVYLLFISNPKKHWIAIGATLALIASVRLQDLVYIIALIPLWKQIRWNRLLLGFWVGFTPQMLAWFLLYGSLANPYLSGGESFNLLRPQIFGVLMSLQSGLFLWTPVVAVGVAGLYLARSEHQRKRVNTQILTYLVIFGAQLYLVASWSTWWQGASVSGRMFVSMLPLIAVGLGEIVRRIYVHTLLRSVLPLIVLGVCVVNAMGIFYYLFTY